MSDVERDKDDDEVDELEANDLTDPEIVTKYKLAGDIANKALAAVLAEVAIGKTPLQLCEVGDKFIEAAVAQVYSKAKKMEKGTAFPTCVSVNHCAGHFSPLSSEDGDPFVEGDVIKVDLGVHLDAYVAQVAHTVVCGDGEVSGPKANVIKAAHDACELALRMVKPGATNTKITAMIAEVAEAYGVSAMQGVMSHQMKKHVIDGNRVIMNKPTIDHKVEEITFEANDVFCIDVIMTTGEGKPTNAGVRCTIYKRAVDHSYYLKMKNSRSFYSEVNKRFTTFPFTLRALSDEKMAKMGVVECANHDLINAYPVLYEKPGTAVRAARGGSPHLTNRRGGRAGDIIAQFKASVLLTATNVLRTTEGPPLGDLTPDKGLQNPELLELLATDISKKKNKKKKKKGAAGGGDAEAEGEGQGAASAAPATEKGE